MTQNKTNNQPLSHCENCHSRVSQEQLQLIKEKKDAVFCSYCGKNLYLTKNFNDNQNSKKEFLEDENDSNINQYKRESFEYYITLFAARIIYDSIVQSDLSSKPIESYNDKLAHALRIEFSEKQLNKEWLGIFRNNNRKRFKKRYREFQAILKRNLKYQENFLIYSHTLIKSVLDLKKYEMELTSLKGIKRDIAEDLINRQLFERDKRFSDIFKQNLFIALSRLIYIKVKYIAQKMNAKIRLIDLDQKVIVKMADSIKNNIITNTKINPEFLNKLYGITLQQFNSAYQNLRTELKESKIYAESFGYLLQLLVKNINLLLSAKRESASLTNLERIIIFELKNLESKLQNNPNLILESSERKSTNETNEKENFLHLKKSRPVVKAFVRDDYKQALKEILKHITTCNLNISDFDDDEVVTQILESIIGPISNAYQKLSDVKKELRIGNKKVFISSYGKIMLEILDLKKRTQQIDIKNIYGVGDDPIKNIIRFLSYNHDTFLPEARFKQINIFKESFNGISFNNVLNHLYKKIKDESFNLEDLEKESFNFYILNSLEIELDSNFSRYHKKVIIIYGRILKILINKGISLNTFKFISNKHKIEKELIYRIANFLVSEIASEENGSNSKQKRDRRVEVNVELLKNIIFELKEELGTSVNKINKMTGANLFNAIGGSTIDYEAFSNLEKFLGKDIPHNVIAGIKRSKKWDFLYIDKGGELLSYDDAIDVAANYLITDILKGDFSNYSKSYISKTLKRGDYINAIDKRFLSFNDILERAGLDLNYEQRWKALYMDGNEVLFEEDIIIRNFGIYLKELIKKNNWDLTYDEGPTYEFLQFHGNGFTQVFASLGIRYNDILESIGLKIRHEIKWTFLDRDLKGKKLSKSEQVRRAAKYLEEIIITKRFLEKHELDQGMPPPYSILENTHSSFMVAITWRKIPFNDILIQAGYQPYEPSIIKELGRDFHNILEALFIKYCASKSIPGFYEHYPSKKTLNQQLKKKYGNNHCDNGVILLNIEDLNFLTRFKNFSSRAKSIPNTIEMLNIDYFFGNSVKRIIKKCLKAYQAKNKMLILMPLHATKYNKHNTPFFIPNQINVKIMHPSEFAEFMGYTGTIYDEFIEVIKLAKRSIFDKNMRTLLRDKAKKAKRFLSQNPQYSQKGLEKFLNEKNILRMDLLEYFP